MPNLWKQFESLLPTPLLLLGTVITQHANRTVTIRLLDGGLLRVTGEAPNNTAVLLRDGKIISPAPALPLIEIQI